MRGLLQYNRVNVKSLLRGEAVILQKRYRKGMRFIFLAEPFGAPVFEVVRVCDEPCAVEEQNAHKAEQHHADKDVEISRIRAIALVKASIRMNSIR